MKREIGEVAWMIPGPVDAQNNITIAARRRSRAAGREGESQVTAAGRKSRSAGRDVRSEGSAS
jgi:hypothetical protein